MSTLKFMEKLIELFKSELGVDSLAFVTFVEHLHLDMNEALSVVLDHGVCCRYYRVERLRKKIDLLANLKSKLISWE